MSRADRRLVSGLPACLALTMAGAMLLAAGGSADGPVIELPAVDRAEIEKYLGQGVVGRAVEAPTIDDPAGFTGLGEGRILTAKIVHGKLAGTTRTVTIDRLNRQDPRPAWRLEAGDDVWYGEVDDAGNFVQHTTEDRKQGVISRYTPPEPILDRGMRPGESKRSRIDVGVFDLARPDRKKHSGYLDLTYSYIGAYEVTVPAGTFEAVLFKWEYEGKVGPANVKDDQYWFFAEGIGPIARIDKKDITAVLIYRDKSKTAAVLESRR